MKYELGELFEFYSFVEYGHRLFTIYPVREKIMAFTYKILPQWPTTKPVVILLVEFLTLPFYSFSSVPHLMSAYRILIWCHDGSQHEGLVLESSLEKQILDQQKYLQEPTCCDTVTSGA